MDSFIQITVFCRPEPRIGAFVYRNAEKVYELLLTSGRNVARWSMITQARKSTSLDDCDVTNLSVSRNIHG